MFDTIVFNQEELISAIENGYCRIALCDDAFIIPDGVEIEYTLLGKASVEHRHYSNMTERYEGYAVNGYGVNLI